VLTVLQTSYLTPPLAPSIFYLRSIAPKEITYGDMYRGVIPFTALILLTAAFVYFIPSTATWLPQILFRL
jgi:TRAP-type mannitol/chloroaromatic compound transport system permease large subunit